MESLEQRMERHKKWWVGLKAQHYLALGDVEVQECGDEFDAEHAFQYLEKNRTFEALHYDLLCGCPNIVDFVTERHLLRKNDVYYIEVDKLEDKYEALIKKNGELLVKFTYKSS